MCSLSLIKLIIFIISLIGGLPPAYLEVPDFEKCLSTQDSQLCLPSTRPSDCPRRSWFELLEKFDGDCPPPITVIGGIGKKNLIKICNL